MNRLQSFVFALVILAAGVARAADTPITGKWVFKNDALRLDMEFKSSGECVATATNADKTSTVAGTYQWGVNELVVTPKGEQPISYKAELRGDKLTLSGGDFGADNKLTFARRHENEVAPTAKVEKTVAAAPAAPAAAADDKTAQGENKLPGGPWDTAALEKHGTLVKSKYDPTNKEVSFVIERSDANYISLRCIFYDEDGVEVGQGQISITPTSGKAGERARVAVKLPEQDVLKKTVKVGFKPQ